MGLEYFMDDGLTKFVASMVNDAAYTEFNMLRAQGVLFLCAFMHKTNADGEDQATSGQPVVIKKISDADKVFVDGHYKLYVDISRWQPVDEIQQKAMLHRTLMRIDIEEGESGIKFGTRKPDIEEFHATVIRFGAWTDSLLQLRDSLNAAKDKKMARKERAKAAAPEKAVELDSELEPETAEI